MAPSQASLIKMSAPEAAEVVQNSAAVIRATCNPIIFETTNQSPQTVDVPIWVGSISYYRFDI